MVGILTDAALLARLHAATFEAPFGSPWTEDAFAGFLAKNTVTALGTQSGFILLQAVGDEWEILTLAVAPSAQRQGLGRALLAAACHHALQATDETLIFLEVAVDNDAACMLYRQNGFVETGRRKGYYKREAGRRVDALLMHKTVKQTEKRD